MKIIVTILRMAIGWHLLYEGAIKLFSENWSAASFLNNTHGFLSGFYHWLAATPGRMEIVDFLNIWGLILIGLALFIGLFSRWASISGALLLLLYYFAYPPFGIALLGGDGTTYVVNPLFVETVILVFLFFYKERGYGIDNLEVIFKRKKTAPDNPEPKEGKHAGPPPGGQSRREALKELVTLPALGLLGWGAYGSHQTYEIDASSGATIQVNRVALNELKGELPKGKLCNIEMSRLIMGGNLIGGWAHARDLIYAESLFKAYNTEKKIFETLMLCEQAGIDTINIGFPTMATMVKYRKLTGSRMKVIVQVAVQEKSNDIFENVKAAIDNGMDVIQMQGNQCDWFVRDHKLDLIDKLLNKIRSEGYVAGLGAHTIDSFITCEENGIIPDYYMKTMHHDNYWSAHPRENRKPFEVDGARSNDHNMFHDNCFCPFPDKTVEFVNRVKVPVMGFKVLAAGAITPEDGFNWAFENGADFICVGMFDFQVVNDVNICIDTLKNLKKRRREWYG
ncbi:DoxX family protein [Proteiniphilum sp.]|uniref:DoxX family protein n=1 Tax=Proteiniphilum sp. TaxID=1926877 RepID=UPI002B1ED450|nr:DoxX family protein [Proteiniphilum sp.]MEA4917787.1 DoxX family protein [Proteiniphilum sp.]